MKQCRLSHQKVTAITMLSVVGSRLILDGLGILRPKKGLGREAPNNGLLSTGFWIRCRPYISRNSEIRESPSPLS
jgi:hypothetical protein